MIIFIPVYIKVIPKIGKFGFSSRELPLLELELLHNLLYGDIYNLPATAQLELELRLRCAYDLSYRRNTERQKEHLESPYHSWLHVDVCT